MSGWGGTAAGPRVSAAGTWCRWGQGKGFSLSKDAGDARESGFCFGTRAEIVGCFFARTQSAPYGPLSETFRTPVEQSEETPRHELSVERAARE